MLVDDVWNDFNQPLFQLLALGTIPSSGIFMAAAADHFWRRSRHYFLKGMQGFGGRNNNFHQLGGRQPRGQGGGRNYGSNRGGGRSHQQPQQQPFQQGGRPPRSVNNPFAQNTGIAMQTSNQAMQVNNNNQGNPFNNSSQPPRGRGRGRGRNSDQNASNPFAQQTKQQGGSIQQNNPFLSQQSQPMQQFSSTGNNPFLNNNQNNQTNQMNSSNNQFANQFSNPFASSNIPPNPPTHQNDPFAGVSATMPFQPYPASTGQPSTQQTGFPNNPFNNSSTQGFSAPSSGIAANPRPPRGSNTFVNPFAPTSTNSMGGFQPTSQIQPQATSDQVKSGIKSIDFKSLLSGGTSSLPPSTSIGPENEQGEMNKLKSVIMTDVSEDNFEPTISIEEKSIDLPNDTILPSEQSIGTEDQTADMDEKLIAWMDNSPFQEFKNLTDDNPYRYLEGKLIFGRLPETAPK